MPQKWKTYKLGDIVILNYGKGLTMKNRVKGDIPVYSSAGHTGWHNQPLIEEEGIIVGRKGSVGTIFKTGGPFYCIDTAYYILKDESKYNINYLYFLLQSLGLNKLNYDSAVPGLNREVAYDQKFLLPDLKEQRAIASILSALDDKIELNLQMNKTLEEMAMALYKHWFVDFGPFQDGEFIDSELGKIPKGWEVKRLDDISTTVLGGTPKRKNESYWKNGTIGWINSGKVNEFRICEPTSFITEEAVTKSSTKIMKAGTTVIAITGATLGQISRIEKDFCANQSVIGITKSKKVSDEFIYLMINNKITDLLKQATGGAQQHINKNDVNELLTIIPPYCFMEQFTNKSLLYFELIKAYCFENQTLTKLRDTLLPKLISGEARVKDIEKTISKII